MLIPRIIHQTWKDDAPPARFASFQAAWRRLHPQWTYRFWTDATARAFVAEARMKPSAAMAAGQ